MQFDYLKKLNVTADLRARYTLSMVSTDGEHSPTLIVRPATEANKAFANEQIKMARKNQNAMRAGAVNLNMVEDTRDNDRSLYAKFVICGWEHVVDNETGEQVPFSAEACKAFLDALPDWIFDEVRNFCGAAQNFVEAVNVEGIVKNS